MGCCYHWHHCPTCEAPPWWYEQVPPPRRRRPRRDEDEIEDYLDHLEAELRRAREELAEARAARARAG